MLTSPVRFSQHLRLAGLLRLNPKKVNTSVNITRFGQEGDIATQESSALFSLSFTWVLRDLSYLAPIRGAVYDIGTIRY